MFMITKRQHESAPCWFNRTFCLLRLCKMREVDKSYLMLSTANANVELGQSKNNFWCVSIQHFGRKDGSDCFQWRLQKKSQFLKSLHLSHMGKGPWRVTLVIFSAVGSNQTYKSIKYMLWNWCQNSMHTKLRCNYGMVSGRLQYCKKWFNCTDV